MQNLIKLAVYVAPVFILALLLILGRLEKNNAEFDVDAARFDCQFAAQQADFSKKIDFWQEEAEEASVRLKVAESQLMEAKGKVAEQLDILEKNLNKIDQKEE